VNPVQKVFYDFFIERTQDGKKEEIRILLEEGFARQAAGTFDKIYLDEIMPKYFELIKPEAAEELKTAMSNFASRL
jgi:hypothetical protein